MKLQFSSNEIAEDFFNFETKSSMCHLKTLISNALLIIFFGQIFSKRKTQQLLEYSYLIFLSSAFPFYFFLFPFSNTVITCRVPRGFILGPLLILICMNDMPQAVISSMFLYTDDSCLVFQGKDFVEIEIDLAFYMVKIKLNLYLLLLNIK